MINLSETTVGIIGAGTMGQGIAHVCADAGCDVVIFDINHDALANAMRRITDGLNALVSKGKISEEDRSRIRSRIRPSVRLEEAAGEVIIEAVIEDLQTKRELFGKLEQTTSQDALLLSNTSSIQISLIGAVLKNPSRFAGLHFFNPAPLMKLVEIVQGAQTSSVTVERVRDFSVAIGKQPVLTQDSPGFIVNRVARPYYVEALRILEEGVADHQTIDILLRNAGFRMGPFELMDLIGVDVNLSVTKSIYKAFNEEARFRPSPIQQQKVDAGLLGRKTGKGFYEYN